MDPSPGAENIRVAQMNITQEKNIKCTVYEEKNNNKIIYFSLDPTPGAENTRAAQEFLFPDKSIEQECNTNNSITHSFKKLPFQDDTWYQNSLYGHIPEHAPQSERLQGWSA